MLCGTAASQPASERSGTSDWLSSAAWSSTPTRAPGAAISLSSLESSTFCSEHFTTARRHRERRRLATTTTRSSGSASSLRCWSWRCFTGRDLSSTPLCLFFGKSMRTRL